jgi:hypothetical protein
VRQQATTTGVVAGKVADDGDMVLLFVSCARRVVLGSLKP